MEINLFLSAHLCLVKFIVVLCRQDFQGIFLKYGHHDNATKPLYW